MENNEVIVLGVGRQGFDAHLAAQVFERSCSLLQRLGWSIHSSGTVFTDPDDAAQYVAALAPSKAKALVLQLCTFADGRFISRILDYLSLPVLIWSVPEPEGGGRLRLNSLTGGNLAASLLTRLGRRFKFVYRSPDEPEAAAELKQWLSCVEAANRLQSARIGQVGPAPAGFDTTSIDGLQLKRLLGAELIRLEQQDVFRRAAEIDENRCAAVLSDLRTKVTGLDHLAADQVAGSIRCYLALSDAAKELRLSALAVRCWPEFFTEYNAAPCSVLSHLIEDGLPAACEADVLGAATMLAQFALTGEATYLGDLVEIDRRSGTGVFWHCGVGACSLASPVTGAVAGVQPTRKIGLAYNNALKAGRVTIARLHQTQDGLAMLIAGGESIHSPNRFEGTSAVVRFDCTAEDLLEAVIYGGCEHHYSIVWRDVRTELREFCRLLNIPAVTL